MVGMIANQTYALVLVGQCAGNIESCEQGKDVGLKALDTHFEEAQSDCHSKGKDGEEFYKECALKHVLATECEEEQEQVASEHISE